MKHSMKAKATFGKISSFLRSLKTKNTKRNMRPARAMLNSMPSSVKVGAGSHYVRRSNPSSIMRKMNHRSSITIPVK